MAFDKRIQAIKDLKELVFHRGEITPDSSRCNLSLRDAKEFIDKISDGLYGDVRNAPDCTRKHVDPNEYASYIIVGNDKVVGYIPGVTPAAARGELMLFAKKYPKYSYLKLYKSVASCTVEAVIAEA